LIGRPRADLAACGWRLPIDAERIKKDPSATKR
jgi:hypothetical protein